MFWPRFLFVCYSVIAQSQYGQWNNLSQDLKWLLLRENYSKFWHKMVTQIVSKSLICLLIDEFNTKVNFLIVQEANLIFVTSEALAWLYAVFFLSDWIREEGKGTNGKYPSTTQQFLAELNASQNAQHGSQMGISRLFLSFPAASWSHNRGYFSVYWCLTVSPAYMYRQHCSSNTVGKRNKNKALKQIRILKGTVALNIWRPFSRSFSTQMYSSLVCLFIAFKILSEFLPHSNHTVQCWATNETHAVLEGLGFGWRHTVIKYRKT